MGYISDCERAMKYLGVKLDIKRREFRRYNDTYRYKVIAYIKDERVCLEYTKQATPTYFKMYRI